MSRLSEPLITRVVVWKQFHLNQWFKRTLRKGWHPLEGGVCTVLVCEILTAVTLNSEVF
jgi:hypothetical protein